MSREVLAGLCLGGASVGYLYFYQENLLYAPSVPVKSPSANPVEYRSPSSYGIPYREMAIPTKDGEVLSAWLLKAKSKSTTRPTLLYFHGNAGNIGLRLPNANRMRDTLDVNLLMVDYRGYGDSTGKPTEEGLMVDAEAVLDAALLEEDIDPTKIGVFGRSLGGAVAIYLAHARPDQISCVIVENTFLDIARMVDAVFPLLSPLKGLILRMDWPSATRINQLRQPVLFLAGTADQLVPHAHMRELHSLCTRGESPDCKFHSVVGGRHENTWLLGGTAYYAAMYDFVKRHLSLAPAVAGAAQTLEPEGDTCASATSESKDAAAEAAAKLKEAVEGGSLKRRGKKQRD